MLPLTALQPCKVFRSRLVSVHYRNHSCFDKITQTTNNKNTTVCQEAKYQATCGNPTNLQNAVHHRNHSCFDKNSQTTNNKYTTVCQEAKYQATCGNLTNLQNAVHHRNHSCFDKNSQTTNNKNTTVYQEAKYQATCGNLTDLQNDTISENSDQINTNKKWKNDATTIKFVNLMQIPPEIDFQKTKEVLDWWTEFIAQENEKDQEYDEERVGRHGPDSAAAHFFIDRQASIKLKDKEAWIVGGRPMLQCCTGGYFIQAERGARDYLIEAIDCTNFHHNGIQFKGLQYLRGLNFLKKLILKNQKHIDAFCLDRIAGQNGETLEYLDISGCNLDMGSFVALSKMYALKELVVSKPVIGSEYAYHLTLLKKYKPGLTIKMV